MRRVSTWVIALSTMSVAVSAQPGPAIVLAPTLGLRVHTVYESTGTLQFIGFPELPDTSVGAYAALVATTHRVTERRLDGWLVETMYDSSRARYRPGRDAAWRSLPTPAAAVGPLRSVVDSRLTETPTGEVRDPWTVRLLRALRSRVEFALPDHPVTAGDRWSGAVSLPYAAELPGMPATVLNVTLSGRATINVDSVVPRAADTLVYVRLQGGLNAARLDTAFVDGDIELPVTVWGSVGSTMVWSSGWDAWVSGTTTMRMHHRVETGPVADREITASASITTRFRIRP